MDDGSPEPVGAIVHDFTDRLGITCLHQKNTGPAGARNAGARATRVSILAFTDDDCRPEPDCRMAEAVRRKLHALAGVGVGICSDQISPMPRHWGPGS